MPKMRPGYVLYSDQGWIDFHLKHSVGQAVGYCRGPGAPMKNVVSGGKLFFVNSKGQPHNVYFCADFDGDSLVELGEAWDHFGKELGAGSKSDWEELASKLPAIQQHGRLRVIRGRNMQPAITPFALEDAKVDAILSAKKGWSIDEPAVSRLLKFFPKSLDAANGDLNGELNSKRPIRYWLTTHWPHRVGVTPPRDTGIWLPNDRHKHGARVSKGDLVAVYESRTGRPLLKVHASGASFTVHCVAGREGVIALGRVQSAIIRDDEIKEEVYVGGTKIRWNWHAPVEVMSRTGFVPRTTLNQILGYKPGYNYRGFGENKSGLGEVSREEFESIRAAFVADCPPALPKTLVPPGKAPVRGAVESMAHKCLKLFVALHPATVLCEEGLTTVDVEYAFGTGDRADVVLADQFNRVVGVEIESAVDPGDNQGPLQAIKYRRMLEWATDRNAGDSRSFLVAYHISSPMKEKCSRYSIECFEVQKSLVEKWSQTEQGQAALAQSKFAEVEVLLE